MSETPNLALPYIAAAQAQKHVTHNEAIRALDAIVQLAVIDRNVTMPPPSPSDGDRYLIPVDAAGAWAGHNLKIAAFQDGAWQIYAPQPGWRAWVINEGTAIFFDGSAWVAVEGNGVLSVNPVSLLGVNTTADAANKLAVKSDAVLFSHDDVTPGTGDMRQFLNKSAAGSTVSQLYQSNWSGRAETGLTGDDDFHVKVSPDGTTWHDAILIDKSTGGVTFPNTALGSGNAIAIDDEGVEVVASASRINFVGASVTATDAGSGVVEIDIAASGGGTSPGGSTTQVQYNLNGAFAGDAHLTYNQATGVLSNAGLKLAAASTGDGAGVISLGSVRFVHSYGTDNTFLGANSGNFTLTTGSAIRNTAFGSNALKVVTTGAQNLAFGWEALTALTTGSDNAGVGNRAMRRVTSGSNNVGVGANAFDNLTTGQLNVGIGRYCGQQLTSGAQNIFLGYVAGGGIETGGGNVVIGGVTGLSPTLSNHVLIATGAGTRRLTIDDNGHAAFEGAVRPKGYTVATLPSAATADAGALAYVSDEAGGPVLAFSDGTAWRRSTDRAVVS